MLQLTKSQRLLEEIAHVEADSRIICDMVSELWPRVGCFGDIEPPHGGRRWRFAVLLGSRLAKFGAGWILVGWPQCYTGPLCSVS